MTIGGNHILTNPKSRGNFAPGAGLTQEEWERIFGKKQDKLDMGDIEIGNKCPKDRPARGDYKFCHELDPFYLAIRRHKDKRSREIINQEYFQAQAEQRRRRNG